MPATTEFTHADIGAGVDDGSPGTAIASSVALPAWMLSSALIGVVVLDDTGRIVFANDGFARFAGLEGAERLIGAPIGEACLEDPSQWRQWCRTGVRTLRLRRADGTEVSVRAEIGSSSASSLGTLYRCVTCLLGDAPETGQLLEHAARMEAVAGLSSGIAHDFNNLLTVLVGNLYLLAEEVRDNESAFARIKAARDTALRGADLTRQLLNYARNDDAGSPDVRPAAVVERLQPLLEKLVGSRIELAVELSAQGASVAANRAQLESAIVNLVINARDAIDGDGAVTVSVAEIENADFSENHIVVRVADSGPGMTDEIRQRVFEPFFTTKAAGRGTGLGLSMVRWFAEEAGGRVEIDSTLGSGTTVSILLPGAGGGAGDTTCSKTIPLSVLPSGDERVALLIDNAEVRAMTQQTLAVLGYDVSGTSIDALAGGSGAADLLIIDADSCQDIVALIDELRSSQPHVSVLALAAGRIGALESTVQLRKPFSLVELASGVRQALDGESGSD